MLSRIVGIPLIIGVSFELIKLAGKYRAKPWVAALIWPGMQLQRLTTQEPDEAQLEVAIAALNAVQSIETPILQSSANLAGGGDPRTLSEVSRELVVGCDLVIDAGRLPGTPSTVVDLARYEAEGGFEAVRIGAVSTDQIRARLA